MTTSRSGRRRPGAPTSSTPRAPSRSTSRTSGFDDEWPHEPVLVEAVLEALPVGHGGRYVDGTVGAGGHSAAILERSAPDGVLLALDVDPLAIGVAGRRLAPYGDRATLVRANFAALDETARAHGFAESDGVLLDLGLSSLQLADSGRGFSFRSSGPLDMRADPELALSAGDLVNGADERRLRQVFADYGEEPEAARVAAAIVRRRTQKPFTTADDLGKFVAGVKRQRVRAIDPATRVFQALRIAVNDELENLERGLRAAVAILRDGGRIAVISFHSLEDRITKRFFARESRNCICPPHLPTCVCGHRAVLRVVSRSPLRADAAEIGRNPRARGAKLRVAEKIA